MLFPQHVVSQDPPRKRHDKSSSQTNPQLAEINLGIFDTFTTRVYIPEPLRCFKCQCFSHHQAKCRVSPCCVICAQPHATEECLPKHKTGKTIAKCPNCGGTSVVKKDKLFYPKVIHLLDLHHIKILPQNPVTSVISPHHSPLHTTNTPVQQTSPIIENAYSTAPVSTTSI